MVRRVIGRRPAILVRGKRSTGLSDEPLKRQKRNIQVGPISVTLNVGSSGEKVQRICLNLSQEERNCVIVNQKSGEKAFVRTELHITGGKAKFGYTDSGYQVIVTENSIEIENDEGNILSLGTSFTKVQAGPLSVTPTNNPSGEKVRNICVKQECVSVSQKAGRNNYAIFTFEVKNKHKLDLGYGYFVILSEDHITVTDGQRTNISLGRRKRSLSDHNRRKISNEPISEKSHNAEATTPKQTFEATNMTSWIHPYQQTNAHSYALPEDVKHQEVITTKTGSNTETHKSAESDETESVERVKRFIKIHQGPEGKRTCYNTGACISQGPWGQVITYPSGEIIQQGFWGQSSDAKKSSRRLKRSPMTIHQGPKGQTICYSSGKCISQGSWGQRITYPSGKIIRQGPDEQRITYPDDSSVHVNHGSSDGQICIGSVCVSGLGSVSISSNHGPQGRSFSIKGNGFDVSVVRGKRSIQDPSENTRSGH